MANDRGLFSDKRAGKTPHQTMKSKLSVHVRKMGAKSVFVWTDAGTFALRALVTPADMNDAPRLVPTRSRERVLVFPSIWLDAKGQREALAFVLRVAPGRDQAFRRES